MKILKGPTKVNVQMTDQEFVVLCKLHQELVDRGLCPHAERGKDRDITGLDKYLEFLPERPCRTIVGHLCSSSEVEMEGHGIDTKMVRWLPEGTWILEITGTEELVADIAKQLCSGSHFVYKGSQRNGRGVQYRVFAQLRRPLGGEGSP